MKNKKGLTPLVIVLIVIAIIGVIGYVAYANQGTNSLSGDGIDVGLYDIDGNPITNALSIVGGVSGVGFIDLTVSATNTGSIPLSCDILSGSIQPTTFDTALTNRQTRIIPNSQKAGWTSGLIAVAPFEGTTTTFSTTVRCSYVLNGETQYLDHEASIILTVSSEGTAGFTVDVTTGGVGACGNGICESSNGEDSTNCLADCPVGIQNVKFRTTDLSYISGGAIAYTDSCGNNLVAYGYTGGSSATSCSSKMMADGYSAVAGFGSLIGGWNAGYNAPSLWKYVGSENKVRICQDKSASPSYYKGYSELDSDASKVSVNPIATGTKEVNCP